MSTAYLMYAWRLGSLREGKGEGTRGKFGTGGTLGGVYERGEETDLWGIE